MTDDQHLSGGAPIALRVGERFVVDHHVGGESVDRHGVRVDQHRVGGAYGLQVSGGRADNVEFVEEAGEEALGTASARVGCGLVREADLAYKIGEATGRVGDFSAMQRVGADSV